MLRPSRIFQILQHFLCMAFGFHVVEQVCDLSVRADHERSA